jgi:hypothetical protein
MDPLTAIDRALDDALQVDPSPALAARVRARVSGARMARRWPVPALTAAIAVAAAVYALLPIRTIEGPQTPGLLVSHAITQRAALPSAALEHRPVAAAESPDTGDILVSPSEMAALQQLFAGIDAVLILPEPPAERLVIPRITIAPLVIASDSEGDRQ